MFFRHPSPPRGRYAVVGGMFAMKVIFFDQQPAREAAPATDNVMSRVNPDKSETHEKAIQATKRFDGR